MKFALFGNTYKHKNSIHLTTLLTALARYKAEVIIDKEFCRFLPEDITKQFAPQQIFTGNNFDADMVISMGGDGTFLKSAMRVGRRGIPILGINTGRLGFLADVSPEEIDKTFQEICNGSYLVENRTVLGIKVDGKPLTGYPYALNEIAILKRDSSSMISIRTHINGALLTTYQADGLVIATPTGSTAYSLSVGGPIMVPHAETITLTPVAPHSLNVRPIVICDNWEITLEVESRSHSFLVALDGRSEGCKEGTRLTISKADYEIKVVKRRNHIFFHTLREKMMWNGSLVD